ncbi:MAG: homoserine dehydrogenase [Candidatus Melainabacteria bacterium]|nr:MAG: homoserine dehydrogenase [Candidatus Melainabacteria bacterium]
MIGLGTVGSGVAQLLSQQRQLVLKKIAVRTLDKPRIVAAPCPVSTNVADLIDDPEIEILIEVMGGEHPALEYVLAAIERRKHIVTANKELIAKHGPALFALASEKGVTIFFEAAVAGGVPLISTMHKGLEATKISSVTGILNGTTNFILSKMEDAGVSYEAALKEAQALGLAESDPTNDVDGLDVAYKLSILSALAFGEFVRPPVIYREGIRKISALDIAQAKQMGYRIKLVGITRKVNKNQLDVRVHPMLVPLGHPLAAVSKHQNGVLVRGDLIEEIIMVGPGAGQMPTASAIVGDVVNLASALKLPDFASYFSLEITSNWAELVEAGQYSCPYYLRLSVSDAPGVIGRIGTILGANKISIDSIIQKGVTNNQASVAILTEEVLNSNMDSAVSELLKCDFLKEIESKLRIFRTESDA